MADLVPYLISTEPLDPEPEYPKYSDPGRVLFRWYKDHDFGVRGWSTEVYDYDPDSCLFLMEQGTGISYRIEQQLDLEQEGWYVAEGVTGSFHTYDGPNGREDSDEFDFGIIRYATEEEIRTECVT